MGGEGGGEDARYSSAGVEHSARRCNCTVAKEEDRQPNRIRVMEKTLQPSHAPVRPSNPGKTFAHSQAQLLRRGFRGLLDEVGRRGFTAWRGTVSNASWRRGDRAIMLNRGARASSGTLPPGCHLADRELLQAKAGLQRQECEDDVGHL